MIDDFSGFPADGLRFLTDLGHSDKAWFDANRPVYDRSVAGPAKSFVVAVGELLATGFAPNIVAAPKANGSIAPINNDVRFAPDKPPYKDHLLFRFWEGADKKTAPTLFVRISEPSVGFAVGAALPDLERWRALVDDEGAGPELAGAIDDLVALHDAEVAGEGYKRVPRPYAADHPRAGLLRHKALQVRWSEPTPTSVGSFDFAPWCVERLAECRAVHRWLVANLG